MKNQAENKAILPGKKDIRNKQRFFYPDRQITIEAETKEEADQALERIEKGE